MKITKRNQEKTKKSGYKKILKEVKKEVKGITLIALVVTVIVLLILAGVTINLTVGDNGLFKRAQNAVDTWQMAEENEQSEMEQATDFIDSYLTGINIEQVTDENPGILEIDEQNIDTYIINSIEDLVFFSYDVTTNGVTYEGKTVKLGTNLDFNSNKSYVDPNSTDYEKYGYSGPIKQALISGTGFKPIGELISNGTKYFYGTFDGNNKAICSLYINMKIDKTTCVGFFTTSYGEIKNLGLLNTNITVQVSQTNEGIGVYADVGGLVADSYNNIYNCYITGNIKGTISSWVTVGGICGAQKQEENRIENCYNLANIQYKRTNDEDYKGSVGGSLGGIVGDGTNINKCYNAGNIIFDAGNNGFSIGGICGSTEKGGIVKNCYNLAKIEGSTKDTKREIYIGGIVGASQLSSVLYCYNSGNIVGQGTNLMIAGIVARQSQNDITISNVFNIGKIDIEGNECYFGGGIIGVVTGNGTYHGNIYNSYNIGKISIETPKSGIGSIAGTNWTSAMTYNNCCYLIGTYDAGVGGGNDTGITELNSIDEFPTVLNIVNEENVFEEDSNNINGGYPILIK